LVQPAQLRQLVSLGLGKPELVDPDGASLGSQTRVFLERSRSIARWGPSASTPTVSSKVPSDLALTSGAGYYQF